jgi:putative transposase
MKAIQKKSNGKSNGSSRSAVEAISVQSAKGRRFTPEQKESACRLVAAGALTRAAIADLMGTTVESLRRWVNEAEGEAQAAPATTQPEPKQPASPVEGHDKRNGKQRVGSPYTPCDPGSGLAEHEVEAIVELKQKHPSMGPAQIRAQLKRFKGWRISNKAIARVLREHGFDRVHRGSRPEGPEPIRFEAPRRNALWQADFTEVRVGAERLHVLVILDDFSRYVVGHALADSPSSQVATATLGLAIARHGKPEAIRTDRGGAFVAFSKETDFGRFLDAELIDHIVGRSYRPQGGGKVESAIGTLRRELWDVFEFSCREEAERRLTDFFREYNEARAHMGIDGLTPADRYFGRADRVLATVDAVSRKRHAAHVRHTEPGSPLEEITSADDGAPLEVLRLVLNDGVMELRFCGARVPLGAIAL